MTKDKKSGNTPSTGNTQFKRGLKNAGNLKDPTQKPPNPRKPSND